MAVSFAVTAAGARQTPGQPTLTAERTDDVPAGFLACGIEPSVSAFPVNATGGVCSRSSRHSSGAATDSHRLPYYPSPMDGTGTMCR